MYNRSKVVGRALSSVKNQTYRNIEHIIVDDGSTDNIDDVVLPYLKNADYPVLYLKKENGGVHTARNLAIKHARGEYILFLDSDDEFIPTAAEEFLKAWNEIPISQRNEYREVVALCMDSSGQQIGNSFENGINEMTGHKRRSAIRKSVGEHTAMNRTEVLKSMPWPEPPGVTFVTEMIVWRQLDQKFRKYYINKCLRIYHTESEDSISKQGKGVKNTSNCVNTIYNLQTILNDKNLSGGNFQTRFKQILIYTILRLNLKQKNQFPPYEWAKSGLKGLGNNLISVIAYIPAWILLNTIFHKRFN